MLDADLLSCPEWTALTDAQLALAIRQAKRRAVQTFALMVARNEETGAIMPLASAELYARHCIIPHKEGAKRLAIWEERRIIDWCDDPRVYHFCTLYDRKYRAREAIPYPEASPLILRMRVRYAYAKVNNVRSRAAREVLAAALAPEGENEAKLRALSETQRLLNATIKMAMICTMELNAYMDDFLR